MSLSTDYLPSREAEFLEWSANFASYIQTHAAALGLLPAQATSYGDLHADLAAAMSAWAAPATHTPAALVTKREKLTQTRSAARALVREIQGYPAVTNEQRTDLRITVRDVEPSPIPPPQLAPTLIVRRTAFGLIEIDILDPTSGDARRPAGVQGATIFTCTGTLPLPNGDAGWLWQGQATKMKKARLEFAPSAAGSKVWIVAMYYSPRGDRGPVSTPISAYLPMEDVAEAA